MPLSSCVLLQIGQFRSLYTSAVEGFLVAINFSSSERAFMRNHKYNSSHVKVAGDTTRQLTMPVLINVFGEILILLIEGRIVIDCVAVLRSFIAPNSECGICTVQRIY